MLAKTYGFRVDIRNRFCLAHQRICWKDAKLHLRMYLSETLTYSHQTLYVILLPYTDHATSVW